MKTLMAALVLFALAMFLLAWRIDSKPGASADERVGAVIPALAGAACIVLDSILFFVWALVHIA